LRRRIVKHGSKDGVGEVGVEFAGAFAIGHEIDFEKNRLNLSISI
jgi:hypothetical protein